MTRVLVLLIVGGLGACAPQPPVAPSPTADQVLAAQYRARGAQGAMSGPEAQAVMSAYGRDIAKPTASPRNAPSSFGEETGSR